MTARDRLNGYEAIAQALSGKLLVQPPGETVWYRAEKASRRKWDTETLRKTHWKIKPPSVKAGAEILGEHTNAKCLAVSRDIAVWEVRCKMTSVTGIGFTDLEGNNVKLNTLEVPW